MIKRWPPFVRDRHAARSQSTAGVLDAGPNGNRGPYEATPQDEHGETPATGAQGGEQGRAATHDGAHAARHDDHRTGAAVLRAHSARRIAQRLGPFLPAWTEELLIGHPEVDVVLSFVFERL
jgi:hypothetical protein